MKKANCPVALTVAGSDSGGQAGLQADLKTFLAFGVHGASVVTAITAQNPRSISRIQPIPPAAVEDQLNAVWRDLQPRAAKTGMLYSNTICEVVAGFFRGHRISLVVDPVMVSTSGTVLLKPSARRVLEKKLLPLATLITPNLREAEVLTAVRVRTEVEMKTAARILHETYGACILIKGGHLRNSRSAVDLFFDGKTTSLLGRPFLARRRLHGAGCTYSAAITACLSRGDTLEQSIATAKEYIFQAIKSIRYVGGYELLNHRVRPYGRGACVQPWSVER